MNNTFRILLRKLRLARSLTMGDVARYLGKSVAYISSVESGRSGPFADQLIVAVADLFEIDASLLLDAKAKDKGVYEVARPESSFIGRQLVLALQAGGSDWTDSEIIAEMRRLGFHYEGEAK